MLTWKEFKDQVEAAGVKDDDRIKWIDMSGWQGSIDVDILQAPFEKREVTIS